MWRDAENKTGAEAPAGFLRYSGAGLARSLSQCSTPHYHRDQFVHLEGVRLFRMCRVFSCVGGLFYRLFPFGIGELELQVSDASAGLFLSDGDPERALGVDLLNGHIQEALAEVRHPVVAGRQLIPLSDPLHSQGNRAFASVTPELAKRLIQAHNQRVGDRVDLDDVVNRKVPAQAGHQRHQLLVDADLVNPDARANAALNQPRVCVITLVIAVIELRPVNRHLFASEPAQCCTNVLAGRARREIVNLRILGNSDRELAVMSDRLTLRHVRHL